jgi:hypothetical protein
VALDAPFGSTPLLRFRNFGALRGARSRCPRLCCCCPWGQEQQRAHTTYVVCGVRVCLFLLKYIQLLISLAISMILGTNVYIYLLLMVPLVVWGT